MNKKNTIPIIFGNLLKKYRLKAGFTQLELAGKCKLDRTYISMLERGVRQPTISSLFKLCEVLKVKASRVIREVENE